MMMSLSHRLDRLVTIQATRETVFRFFTDETRWASWWGAGSTIDAHPGGQVRIQYPNGVEASGEVVDVRAPERLVFTYGYVSGKPIPPGSSRVTITLEPFEAGTRLHLSHEFADASVRDEHIQGWRYQLSLFANAVANDANAQATGSVDAWFDAWRETDERLREHAFARLIGPSGRFRDQYSSVDGLAELVAHVGAYQRFMPGIRLERRGGIRHCQGTVLVDWVGVGSDGQDFGSGTNVFVLGLDGRFETVTGFWNPRTK